MEAAERGLKRATPQLQDNPLAFASLLPALMDAVRPASKLVISGTDPDAQNAMKRWADSHYRLDCYLVGPEPGNLPGVLREFRSDQPVTAWLCRGTQCLPPVETQDELNRLLSEVKG